MLESFLFCNPTDLFGECWEDSRLILFTRCHEPGTRGAALLRTQTARLAGPSERHQQLDQQELRGGLAKGLLIGQSCSRDRPQLVDGFSVEPPTSVGVRRSPTRGWTPGSGGPQGEGILIGLYGKVQFDTIRTDCTNHTTRRVDRNFA